VAIGVAAVLVFWGAYVLLLYPRRVGVTRKVLESVTIVVLVGLHLYSFLIKGFDFIRVGIYLWELSCHHLVVIWAC
jgi:hypothetical protein